MRDHFIFVPHRKYLTNLFLLNTKGQDIKKIQREEVGAFAIFAKIKKNVGGSYVCCNMSEVKYMGFGDLVFFEDVSEGLCFFYEMYLLLTCGKEFFYPLKG
jgi:hypothetical protein